MRTFCCGLSTGCPTRALTPTDREYGWADHVVHSHDPQVGRTGDTSCQHALFYLRWLDRTPESFLVDAAPETGAPLPPCGPDRRPRWDLGQTHAALAEARRARGLTWAATAEVLRCTPSQLTGLKTARFATGMSLATSITQGLERPAADFIHPA